MQRKIYDWSKKYIGNDGSKTKILLITFSVFMLMTGVVGAGAYYQHQIQKQEEEEKARKQAIVKKQIQNIKKFYQTSLAGYTPVQFISLMSDIYRSRKPLELLGFIESDFLCDEQKCSFSYTREGGIFITQSKTFRGKVYPPSFSEKKVEYADVVVKQDLNPVLDNFYKKKPIAAYDCNDVLNYVYGFNSSVAQSEKFTIVALPSSSVSADEAAQPNLPESYRLLFSTWSVTLPDNYIDMYTFWTRHSFQDFFIIKSVEKSEKKSTNLLTIKGVFLCKK